MDDTLEKVVIYWNEWLKNSIQWHSRDSYPLKKFDKSLGQAYIGVRRSGKTTLACLNALKYSKKICYMNFEDPFFVNNHDVLLLEQITDIFKTIYKKSPEILILDEIQNIPFWEKFARKIIDTRRFQLIVTGSSSKLLSAEISSSLTGRCLETSVWPLSFKEFLSFHKKSCRTTADYLKELEKYAYSGGFPKVTLERDNSEKNLLLKQYLQDLIYKDIVLRYTIRNIALLNKMIQYLLTNISSKHSFNSIQRAFGINAVTAQEYAHYCENAFLFFFIKKYDKNIKIQNRNPQKVYCIDTGLRQANAFYHSLDSGKITENLIFIELKRRGYKDIFYYQGNYEVDFLVLESGKPNLAINVSNSNLVDEKVYEREVNGMLECLRFNELKKGLILTKSLNTTEIIDGKEIEFFPIYKYLLGEG